MRQNLFINGSSFFLPHFLTNPRQIMDKHTEKYYPTQSEDDFLQMNKYLNFEGKDKEVLRMNKCFSLHFEKDFYSLENFKGLSSKPTSRTPINVYINIFNSLASMTGLNIFSVDRNHGTIISWEEIDEMAIEVLKRLTKIPVRVLKTVLQALNVSIMEIETFIETM